METKSRTPGDTNYESIWLLVFKTFWPLLFIMSQLLKLLFPLSPPVPCGWVVWWQNTTIQRTPTTLYWAHVIRTILFLFVDRRDWFGDELVNVTHLIRSKGFIERLPQKNRSKAKEIHSHIDWDSTKAYSNINCRRNSINSSVSLRKVWKQIRWRIWLNFTRQGSWGIT